MSIVLAVERLEISSLEYIGMYFAVMHRTTIKRLSAHWLRFALMLCLALSLIGSNAVLIGYLPMYKLFRGVLPAYALLCLLVLRRGGIPIAAPARQAFILAGYWVFVGVASVYWAPDTSMALKYNGHLAMGLALMMLSYISANHSPKASVRTWLIVVTFALLVAVLEVYDVLHIRRAMDPDFRSAGAFSFFGYNELAFVCTLTFPMVVLRDGERGSVVFAGLCALIVWSVAYTGSTLGVVCIVLEMLLAFIVARRHLRRVLLRKSVFLMLVLATALLVYSLYPPATDILNQHLYPIEVWRQTGEIYTSRRTELFMFSISTWLSSPITGVGAGGDSAAIVNAGLPGNTHNWMLEVLVNFGPSVVLPFVWLWACTTRRLMCQSAMGNAQASADEWVRVGFGISMAMLPITGMMCSSLLRQNSYWIFSGIGLAIASRTRGWLPTE